jgi:hypothetical protein
VDLVVSDVHGGNPCGAVLEQAVGETAGRCADIEAFGACDIDLEGGKGRFKFLAAAAYEAGLGKKRYRCVVRDNVSWLRVGMPVDKDFAGKNKAFGLLAALHEAALKNECVETLAVCGHLRLF